MSNLLFEPLLNAAGNDPHGVENLLKDFCKRYGLPDITEESNKLHERVPNSELMFIERFVNVFGEEENGVKKVCLRKFTNGLSKIEPCPFPFAGDPDEQLPSELYAIAVNSNKEGWKRFVFTYVFPEGITGKFKRLAYKINAHFDKDLGMYIREEDAGVLEYPDLADLAGYLLSFDPEKRPEWNDPDEVWHLSFIPSLVSPESGDSLYIQDGGTVKDAYATASFGSYREAISARNVIFDKVIGEKPVRAMYSLILCNTTSFDFEEEDKRAIIDAINEVN